MPDPRLLADLVDLRRLADLGVDLAATAITDGTTTLSWYEYDDRVGRMAGTLRSLGVRPGDRVGVRLLKSTWSFVAAHAIVRAGAIVVPFDPWAPLEQASGIAADADVEVMVTDRRSGGTVAGAAALAGVRAMVFPNVVGVELDVGDRDGGGELTVVDAAGIAACDPMTRPVVGAQAADADDPAYVIYTSGSTGTPKGIIHTHRSALAYARAAAAVYSLTVADRLANIAPLHFDQSTFELYAAPLAGASVLVVPDPVLRFPASVSEMLEEHGVTVWYSVPFLLEQLSTRGALDERRLDRLRLVLFGGEAFSPARLATVMRQLPGVTFSNVYGPAEVNQCTVFDLTEPPEPDRPVPIGHAWSAAAVRVVDQHDADVDAEPGSVGVLHVSTPTAMAGYWRRPDLTAAAFHETDDGRRWYVTGDLVEADTDGELVFVGRLDNQVKVRGYRIELEAVDAVLLEPSSVSSATTVVERRGDGEDRLVALIVADPRSGDAVVATADVMTAARSRLPRYAVPSAVLVVDDLPRTATGKVDRGASAALLASGRVDVIAWPEPTQILPRTSPGSADTEEPQS